MNLSELNKEEEKLLSEHVKLMKEREALHERYKQSQSTNKVLKARLKVNDYDLCWVEAHIQENTRKILKIVEGENNES